VGATPSRHRRRPGRRLRAGGLRTYTDHDHGFRGLFPAGLATDADRQRVLLAISGGDAVNITAPCWRTRSNAGNIAELRAVTERRAGYPQRAPNHPEVCATQLGGLPGMYYLYAFSAGAQRGAHTHYFAFAGREHVTPWSCQALRPPTSARWPPDFDAVVSSFRPLPA